MFDSNHCPRCHQLISEERLSSSPQVCDSCGLVLTEMEKQVKFQFERTSRISLVTFSILLLAGFMHLMNWGTYSLTVLPLQVKTWLSLDSSDDDEKLAGICLELSHLDCVERLYVHQASLDASGLIRLGKFQFERHEFVRASEAFHKYLDGGGKDLDAMYFYARSLVELGQLDEAVKYFDMILLAQPKVVQVTVAQSYVRTLIDHGRFSQALKVIQSLRKTSENGAQWMTIEYQVILEKLGRKTG
jgi:tetratricopeptide (TPR) repeat protein